MNLYRVVMLLCYFSNDVDTFASRSKITEDTANLNAMLDNLRSEIEGHKRELINAKNQINSLSAQLESGKMEMMVLREECKTKDRMLEVLLKVA